MSVKIGPCRKLKSKLHIEDVGAGNVGRHQVRRELDAAEIRANDARPAS